MSLLSKMFSASEISPKGKLQYIKQREIGGDGLACIAMLCSFHGVGLGLRDLEQSYPELRHGIGLRNIIDILHKNNLITRALQCPLTDIANVSLPALLHWNMAQFVVLTAIRNNKYTVYDPSLKIRELSLHEFEQCYGEILLEVTSFKEE